ncbi:hypothetical protein CC85DRAFT_286758 [Cutaneotrichosporon oleaginosum]|uniref:DNA-directed RNA polymerase III subunit n=1 Tax=Cutaneotrichosporon oleaginosum TaxID=879819 RepID=A0A0J0XJH0_9TREE|nr:uncharacterized protein CC85DRAFT_286758 [Cutaneotrichosporon oleaginosum]KLT41201.1 hypothetical protein CC85DRAFT_286758 [Cutaneotrichosporon oleaginosum]TXT14082.1 hypothetical protein COLE_00275 [Cutaneotrichosporon oleaginosum]
MPGPTAFEERVVAHTNALLRDLAEGLADADGARAGAPWRLESERKVVGIEIESYSDRYRRPGAGTGTGNSRLDPAVLYLNRELFPPSLWKEYFEGDMGAEKKARAIARANRRKRVLDEDDDEEGEPSENEEDEEDFDFDDEDEEDHQDYDHNYFDNGEGDDDSGGEGGEDEGGRYDD